MERGRRIKPVDLTLGAVFSTDFSVRLSSDFQEFSLGFSILGCIPKFFVKLSSKWVPDGWECAIAGINLRVENNLIAKVTSISFHIY
jgi:hypothetical protein